MFPLKDNVPTRTTPYVTIFLIAANFAAWAWELTGPGVNAHVFEDGYYPCSVDPPCAPGVHPIAWYFGIFTAMFLHASWLHILGNMLFLWIFGNNVEDSLGHIRYFFWYLACGVAAIFTQTAVTLAVGNMTDKSIPNIGASGAVAGVLGAYFVLLPRAKVLTLIFFGIILIREIPAVWFLGIWIVLQIFSGGLSLLSPESGGGTAFFAHIGGFVFGAATVRLVAQQRPRAPTSRYPVY